MGFPLKYNTASQIVPLGQFLDNTDGDTEENALSIANTDIKLWKSAATTLVNKNSGGATFMSNGAYYATFDATDTNTYGPMVIFIHITGALVVRLECEVMNPDAYDALMAANGTGHIEASIEKLGGVVQSAADLKNFADAGYDPATNKVQGVVLVDTTTTNTDMRGTDNAATASALSTHDGKLDMAQTDLDTITGADGVTLATSQANYAPATVSGLSTHDGKLDTITSTVGVAGVGLTNLGGMSSGMKAEVNAECDTAISGYNTTAMTESYAADGATMTPEQARHMIWSALHEFAISGTTITSKKLDGSTTAMTHTIDDATNPTSRTRAT